MPIVYIITTVSNTASCYLIYGCFLLSPTNLVSVCDLSVQFFMDTKSLRRRILEDLASGRQYCVSVCFSDSLVLRESNYSQPVCAFTPGFSTAGTAHCVSVHFSFIVTLSKYINLKL